MASPIVDPVDRAERMEIAATVYAMTGSLKQAGAAASVSLQTIYNWQTEDFFQKKFDLVLTERSSEVKARMRNIIAKCTESIIDRIDNGDSKLDHGDLIRVPMQGKDLAVVMGITTQRLLEIEGKAPGQTASVDQLQLLADKLERLAGLQGKVIQHTQEHIEEMPQDNTLNTLDHIVKPSIEDRNNTNAIDTDGQ